MWCLLAGLATAWAIDEVEHSPDIQITSPADLSTVAPTALLTLRGQAVGRTGRGSVLPVDTYQWRVIRVRDNQEVFRESGVSETRWRVPRVREFEMYRIEMSATDESYAPSHYETGEPRRATNEVLVFSCWWDTVRTSTLANTIDGFVEEARPGSLNDRTKAVVKNPPFTGNSRMAFWVFDLGNTPADHVWFRVFAQNEISGGGHFQMAWRPGWVDANFMTWNNMPRDFTNVQQVPIEPMEAYPGWLDFDMTSFHNGHLGETVTIRLSDTQGRQIGPHLETLESIFYPQNRPGELLLIHEPGPAPDDTDWAPIIDTGPEDPPEPTPTPEPQPTPDGTPEEPDPDEPPDQWVPEGDFGCGCASGARGGWWLLCIGLLVRRRAR